MASLCAASIRMQPLLFTPVGGNPQRPVILAQPWRPGLSRPCPRGSPPPPPRRAIPPRPKAMVKALLFPALPSVLGAT